MDKNLKCLVVDDEVAFINMLKSMISLSPEKNLEIVGEARSVKAALEQIEELEPDLVFLDIKLPDGTGFDVLKRCERKDFKIIFITAFDQYAIEAFRHSAVDYLMKPVSSRDLWSAVAKAGEELSKTDRELQMNILINNLEEIRSERKKLILREGENLHIVQVRDIDWCEAQGSYTHFHFQDDDPILVCHHLKDYESLLSESGFFRTHRSFLVNVSKIKRFDKSEGGSIYLIDGTRLPVSFRKKEKLLQILEEL